LLEKLGEERDKLFAAQLDPDERKPVLHDLASTDAFKTFLRKRRELRSDPRDWARLDRAAARGGRNSCKRVTPEGSILR
jgi:hypothetical protein